VTRNLIFLLGDQLTPAISALAGADKSRDAVLMAEVADETDYVRHHKKKIAFLFSAMRHFAEELRGLGWTVDYVRLDDPANTGSLTGELGRAVARHAPGGIVATEAGEWRVREMQRAWADALAVPADLREDTRFLCSHDAFAAWADGRKQLRMEFFYRDMRRKTGLLMEDGGPAGGRWNFDAENRKPARGGLFMPHPPRAEPDAVTQEVLALVASRFSGHFGDLEPFRFAVTRADAQAAARHFMRACLPSFGDFQDAMLSGEKFLYHSVLSHYLNCGLLDAMDLCRAAEAQWRAGRAPLNAVEGFIRQILGWREFVRGFYWRFMPGLTGMNALGATRPLPGFYWTGETRMACVRAAVTQTREEAYAHHIQRLMVTGNFALLAGIDPREVHEWYLSVYADAYEWVEAPNTIGMALHADGGLLASKPYAASGAYIDRMSDYCGTCAYDVKAKTGARACPFNRLYWDFVARHRERFAPNARMSQIVRGYDRFDETRKAAIATDAQACLLEIESL
jgi:deoxyribodipyrimidine photolyase-related protein